MILSIEYPPISAGIPVFGIAQPSWITLPRLCSSHSLHYYVAVFSSGKSRSDPITNSAASIVVPRFFFCQYCIYNYICLILFQILKSWIHKKRYIPFFILSSICSGPSVSFAVTCSTSAFPSYTALENAIVRRTDQWNFRLCHNNFKSAFI